jgi:hypothetical protein
MEGEGMVVTGQPGLTEPNVTLSTMDHTLVLVDTKSWFVPRGKGKPLMGPSPSGSDH